MNVPESSQGREEPTAAGGYDAALIDERLDLLGRRHVARRIHRLLVGTPADWSVRVGVLGDWGEGKTTVAKWVKATAERDGHVVAWFSPAASASADELWAGVAEAVVEAADNQKVPTEATAKLRAFVAGRDTAKRVKDVAQAFKLGQVLQTAADNFLRIGPGHLKELRKALGEGRRVVVVIDDLDRADPKLLPGLLLALRDVLDLSGFSFLLPFDERAVAATLEGYNAAWGDGRRFLDKILDFRIHLAPAKPVERRRLFEGKAASTCPFLPGGAAAGLEELLPENPRRLKALARGISLLQDEANRHRPDEIDWPSVLYGSLVREESESFYRAYVEDTFAAVGSGGLPINRQLNRRIGKKDGDAVEQARITALLNQHAADRPDGHDRLRALCDAWLRHTGLVSPGKALYATRLMDAAETGVTWAERDTALRLYCEDRSAKRVAAWVGKEAEARSVAPDILARTLIQALCVGYGRILEAASNAVLASEHAAVLAEAGLTLDLLSGLAEVGLPGLPPEETRAAAFARLVGEVQHWMRFDQNPGETELRTREIDLLSAWAAGAGSRRASYVAAIENPDGIMERIIAGRDTPLRRALLARLGPPDVEVALDALSRPDGIRGLAAMGASMQARASLLNPSGPLWTPPGNSPAEALLAQAAERPELQKNALVALDLLSVALQGDLLPAYVTSNPETFLQSRALRALWSAATATPLQFRMLQELRDRRKELVARGAPEDAMPIPPWLVAR